jgi:hypothetical protein
VEPQKQLFGSIRVRHFGPRPLIEDASVRSRATTVWNAEAGYRLSSRSRVVLEAYNLFAAGVADIDYFYRSRLAGEPSGGRRHPHPPRDSAPHPTQPSGGVLTGASRSWARDSGRSVDAWNTEGVPAD